jgi:hypothetical protein
MKEVNRRAYPAKIVKIMNPSAKYLNGRVKNAV